MVTTSDAKSSDQGVTLNISQTIGDTSRFYVVFTAKNVPKTTRELGFKGKKLQVGGKMDTAIPWMVQNKQRLMEKQ